MFLNFLNHQIAQNITYFDLLEINPRLIYCEAVFSKAIIYWKLLNFHHVSSLNFLRVLLIRMKLCLNDISDNSSVISQMGKSQKRNISYSLIPTCACAYYGVRNGRFSENLACFVFLQHLFWDLPFCLITDELKLTYFSPLLNFK